MHLVLFFIFGGLCVAGALNLLLQRHPIYSALSLIVVMSSLAVLYLLLGAEFLAAAQVIVYSGAIMVLFTFVIMLLNAGREERTHGSKAAYLIGFPGAAALLALLVYTFLSYREQLGGVPRRISGCSHAPGVPGLHFSLESRASWQCQPRKLSGNHWRSEPGTLP